MEQRPSPASPLRSRTFVGLALVVILFVLFGLLAVSYTLFAAAAIGIALAVVILVLVRVLSRRQLIAVLAVVAVAVLFLLAATLRKGPRIYHEELAASVPAYSVTISPGAQPGTFVVSEEADVQMESFLAPAAPASRVKQSETVTAQSKGLFLQEVTITPLTNLHVSLPSGAQVSPALVTDMDSRLTVKLQDIPRGSFYAARHALSLASHPYLDTETLTWSPTDLSEAITFAYVPSPANRLRPLLGPFLTASSMSQWAVGAMVTLLAALFGTFVQPAVMGRLKTTLSPWLPARMKEEKHSSPPAPPK